MSFSKAFSALFESDDANEVKHDKFTSMRFMAMIAFVGLIVWTTKGLLTDANLHLIFYAFAVYVAGDTATRMMQILVNGRIKLAEVKAFTSDGTLDANETKVLSATAEVTTKSTP